MHIILKGEPKQQLHSCREIVHANMRLATFTPGSSETVVVAPETIVSQDFIYKTIIRIGSIVIQRKGLVYHGIDILKEILSECTQHLQNPDLTPESETLLVSINQQAITVLEQILEKIPVHTRAFKTALTHISEAMGLKSESIRISVPTLAETAQETPVNISVAYLAALEPESVQCGDTGRELIKEGIDIDRTNVIVHHIKTVYMHASQLIQSIHETQRNGSSQSSIDSDLRYYCFSLLSFAKNHQPPKLVNNSIARIVHFCLLSLVAHDTLVRPDENGDSKLTPGGALGAGIRNLILDQTITGYRHLDRHPHDMHATFPADHPLEHLRGRTLEQALTPHMQIYIAREHSSAISEDMILTEESSFTTDMPTGSDISEAIHGAATKAR